MRLVACINAYQDAPLLGACLESVRAVTDAVVVVDGRYRDFPSYGADDQGASTDGTLDVARAAGATIVEAPDGKPWPDEIVKRTAYLNALGAGDYALVVDADERVEADGPIDRALLVTRADWTVLHYREEQRELNAARHMKGDEAKAHRSLNLHRLFAWRPGLHYRGTHHVLHYGPGPTDFVDPKSIDTDDAARFPGLRLCHVTRTDLVRTARKGRYYAKLAKAEELWRAKYLGESRDRTGVPTP